MATIPDGLQRSRLLCHCRAKRSTTSAFHCRSATVQTRYCSQSCYRTSAISAANETLLSKIQRGSSGWKDNTVFSILQKCWQSSWHLKKSDAWRSQRLEISALPMRHCSSIFIDFRPCWGHGWPGFDFH